MLVLVNGLPGSGKSTLARQWCEHTTSPLPLALDIDVIRSMLGGWRSNLTEAGLTARALTIAAITAHLRAGRDVLVPQYLPRSGFIDELADTARREDAVFVECALQIDHPTASRRFTARAAEHSNDHHGPEGELGEPMDAAHAAFQRFLTTRPGLHVLDAHNPDLIHQLTTAINRARTGQ